MMSGPIEVTGVNGHVSRAELRVIAAALRQAVETVCPIYNLLKDPQTITGRIVRARYEPSAKSN